VADETPVSWFLIEPGWEVLDSQGERVGRVEETTGDSTHDIFDGLTIAPGVFGTTRYVPSEQVAEIVEGRVRLKLTKSEVEQLTPYKEAPATAEIGPYDANVSERLARPVRARPGGPLRQLVVRVRALLRLPER
jgi:hypothetical protein